MADDVTPSDVRARRFETTRRGYDRSEVDSYLVSLADEIDRINAKLEKRKTKELRVGLDDPESLALELGSIGDEVAAILESARAAADGMRSRATDDVESWRSTTQRETQLLSSEATEQSQSMRAAAWNEGTSMLSSSMAEAIALVEAAREDALFIRAEAEREAIRLTGDAKRDRDEHIRGARLEAEEMIERARGESDGMLAAANQQAEQAQERARALEDRRAELLSELESTRASISHLEEEIDSRRQELDTPEPDPEPEPDPRTHHSADTGSVRIVAPSRSVTLKPVDAEEVVADVVALRTRTPIIPDETVSPPSEPVEATTVAVIAPPPPEPAEAPTSEPDDDGPESGGDSQSAEVHSASDDIGSLFASLREHTDTPPDQVAVTQELPEEASVPEIQEQESSPETTVDDEPEADSSSATLIPLQNAALKEIKRSLVDLQNDALEHLRTDTQWIPTKTFTNKFKAPFGELAAAITGSKARGNDAAKEFSADLNAAVGGAIDKMRESGAGDREVASAVSRVFRMWRADESERRVLDAARELHEESRS